MPSFKKFSWVELTSNSCGKTSPALTSAFFQIIPTGCIGFIIACLREHSELAIHSVAVITVGASLMGIRRFTKDKDIKDEKDSADTPTV